MVSNVARAAVILMKYQQAQQLLAEGKMSQRQIARHVGIGRATVQAIAAGNRAEHMRALARRAEMQETEGLFPSGPPVRCPGCGGKVCLPCRLCLIRQYRARQVSAQKAARRRQRLERTRQLLAAVQHAAQCRDACTRSHHC